MLFLTAQGNYVEINKTKYVNDTLYYEAIMTAKGLNIIKPEKNINDKIINIIKK